MLNSEIIWKSEELMLFRNLNILDSKSNFHKAWMIGKDKALTLSIYSNIHSFLYKMFLWTILELQ